jgi:ATP-dependent Clp protease ATP-binding subunit ClpA
MLERLSDQAARATEVARDEARSLGHGHVGTEHLLLGILAEGDNPAAKALLAAGATLYGCRQMAAEAVGETSPARATGELPYTERASRALERASRLALRRRDPQVETTHILASVLDVEGRAGQVLRGLGVDPTRVHQALDNQATRAAPLEVTEAVVSEVPAPDAASPVCANCGTSLQRSLGQRVLTARSETGPASEWLVAYCTSCGSAIGALGVNGA